VDASELRHRVVAVFQEDSLVEPFGSLDARRRSVARSIRWGETVSGELVEEQAPKRLPGARVPGEQRALDDFGQVDEREDGPVEVREVRGEDGPLLLRERFRDEVQWARSSGKEGRR
jgi:hypothetical protein